jgi:hypothetical protein
MIKEGDKQLLSLKGSVFLWVGDGRFLKVCEMRDSIWKRKEIENTANQDYQEVMISTGKLFKKCTSQYRDEKPPVEF